MLKKLTVQNYALIDRVELNFGEGLNIITGETGAGKSILLGALSLILGQRADSSSLTDSTRKSIVEGEFLIPEDQDAFLRFFRENELDHERTTVLRREINADGKSRAFINDTPVNLHQLRALGDLLIDIHSQHETLKLNKSEFQLSALDAFSGLKNESEDYKKKYIEYLSSKEALKKLMETENKARSDQDYFQYQFNELEEAGLRTGEQEELENELRSLTHAGEILEGISDAVNLIAGNEEGILHTVRQLNSRLRQLSAFNSNLAEIAERLRSSEIELKDISNELESISGLVNSDPSRKEILNERLNEIYSLQQKHRVKTVDDLISLRDDFSQKLNAISSLEGQIIVERDKCEKERQKLMIQAARMSAKRCKSIPSFEQQIKKLLKEVGMPDAILKVENTVSTETEPGPAGIDSISFLFSANKGIAYSEISKVASGGELSRLMLCLKASIANLTELPTLIFDEIDTGVSGETALRIGQLMHEISSDHQLLVITHLPQIAGRGDTHFYVYKEVRDKKTWTRVKTLNKEERVIEVARMLSGDKPTSIAIENAKELMKA